VDTPSQVYILVTGYRPVGSPFSGGNQLNFSLIVPWRFPMTFLSERLTSHSGSQSGGRGHTLGVLNARIEYGYSIRSAMTVTGRIVGQACSNSRIRGSRASTTGPVECPSTLARRRPMPSSLCSSNNPSSLSRVDDGPLRYAMVGALPGRGRSPLRATAPRGVARPANRPTLVRR
jgi:hypothetical protein